MLYKEDIRSKDHFENIFYALNAEQIKEFANLFLDKSNVLEVIVKSKKEIMKNLVLVLIVCLGLVACDKESITIQGELKNSEKFLIVKMKSVSGEKEQILDTIEVDDSQFKFKLREIKPPVKLTFSTVDSCEFDVWLGEYGTKLVSIDIKKDCGAKLVGSFFYDELHRVQETYDKMYLNPIKSKLVYLAKLNKEVMSGRVMDTEEELFKYELEKKKKTAYRLRKKSILKTVRKNPSNPVSMGLMYDEYERLTKWQKKEAKKYMTKYFSDTGLNWQFKN